MFSSVVEMDANEYRTPDSSIQDADDPVLFGDLLRRQRAVLTSILHFICTLSVLLGMSLCVYNLMSLYKWWMVTSSVLLPEELVTVQSVGALAVNSFVLLMWGIGFVLLVVRKKAYFVFILMGISAVVGAWIWLIATAVSYSILTQAIYWAILLVFVFMHVMFYRHGAESV
ncbi:MAG: hypothetical protein JXR76_01725 [Deltaproteobacteria bacterium]|nr:hypothetical protein [Deltaproteobacteria bacterium]